ncbi:MAG: pitrilysin family protein [Polyangiales bacterium]
MDLLKQLEHPREELVLDNGLRVLVLPTPGRVSAAASLYVKCGSRFEEVSTNGLSHVVEHMVFRGSERHPTSAALNLAIEEHGAHVEATTSVDLTSYEVLGPRETVLEAMEIFAEVFRAPCFEGFDVEKQILKAEIEEELDEQGRSYDVSDLSRKQLYPQHPLGFAVSGTLANVARFTVADLQKHLARFYVASNAILAVAGDLRIDDVVAAAQRAFGDWRRGDPVVLETPSVAAKKPFVALDDPGGAQSDLRVAWRTVGARADDARPLQVVERLLDDGLAARLQKRVVDEKGLAYHVSAGADLFEDVGAFDVAASVAHGKAPTMVREALQMTRELATSVAPDAELDRVRRRYVWSQRALLDVPRDLASFYGSGRLLGLDETLASAVASFVDVDAERARAAAERVFGAQAFVACVGELPRSAERQIKAML